MRILSRIGGWMLLVAMAVNGPLAAKAQESSGAEALRVFETAAFGDSVQLVSALYRWEGGVTVRFTGTAAVRHRAWAEEQLEELRELSGLDLRRIDQIGADILVVFVEGFEQVTAGKYNDLLDRFVAGAGRRDALLEGFRRAETVCAGQVVARGNVLTGGIVFIPRDQMAPVVRSCISAQITRLLGLPFAVPDDARSVLAINSPHAHLTRPDRLAIQLLYHPRMRAGMSREDAATVARSVLPEILARQD